MRLISVVVLGVALIFINLPLPAQQKDQKGTQVQRQGKSGSYHILNKGANDGVKVDMRGKVWTKQQLGDKLNNVDIGRFRVVKVEKNRCFVIVDFDAGFSDKDFQWATFVEELVPPKIFTPPKQPRKTGPTMSLGIPPGKSIEWYLERGEKYYEAGEYKLAEICFSKVLEKDAEDPGALFWLKKTREKLATIDKQMTYRERKRKKDEYITRGDHFFGKGKFETAIAYFIKAFKIFEEDNLLAAEKILKIYKKNKELFKTKIKKENLDAKEICNKAFSLAENRINEGKLEKTIWLMNIFNQLGLSEINRKILNILETSDANFGNEDVIKGNSSGEDYREFLTQLIDFIKEKYLNEEDEIGLNVLLKFTFARGYSEYEELKQMFEANISFAQYMNLGDQKFNEKQYEDAEGFYIRAAKIKPDNAEVKHRIAQCRKMINATIQVKTPDSKPEEKPVGEENFKRKIDTLLEALSRKDLSESEKGEIAKEVYRLIKAADNLEALIETFDKYIDIPVYLRSLKFQFYKNLVDKFKNTDLDKYFKYFELYRKFGRVNAKEFEEYMLKKRKMANEILTFDEARIHIGEKISRYYKNGSNMWEIELKNGMKFVFIPAGLYQLQLRYVFVDSFFIGKYEVTNRYYETFCQQNEIKFQIKKKRYNHPVVDINWYYAQMYSQWLSKQTELNIDLPTEAQWEKAALSGSSTIYFWGEKINRDYLWYWGNSGFKLHEVGKKIPNHWEIHDILGNAAEWIRDWFAPIKKDVVVNKYFTNPIGPKRGVNKVVKGGGWYNSHKEVTIPHRVSKNPKSKNKTIGFRVVINLKNLAF